ncbi:SDR family NAD(P)-dependent oxidoreductase [Nocardia bovistercoris]|uniref:SDR family NAD(P)-dependent oxidoreductase n=1 Tax=Nocardia bovistercoris TaxID=2785916 RepID=A0A931IEW1_9NOCA|nr:SDR family NAD(P)-dependent oxidoreductase [Nocardia bovistercoris]MBH0780219.1 SDR family NAD(P)-dependent oxidoreductase [Nocardia bovistercoris]
MSGRGILWGRGAVVVGGSSGIGFAVAAALARQGAGVVLNGRNEAAVERAANTLRMSGHRVLGVPGSAADESVAEKLIQTCVTTYGAVDVLVNCAGAPEPAGSSILSIKPWEWRALLDSHLTTVFNTCRVAAPLMVERGRGSIINTSSFAYLGDFGGTGYAAGKGAVTSLTLAMAAELREHGVRANIVCPGAKTRLSSGLDYEARILDLYRRGILDKVSMSGALDAPPAEYVAQLYLYLAGDRSAEVTGQIFIGAGGFIGRFNRPKTAVLGYRDHADAAPWTLPELHAMIGEPAPSTAAG